MYHSFILLYILFTDLFVYFFNSLLISLLFQFDSCGYNCKIINIFCLSRKISVSTVTILPAEQPRNRGPIPGRGKTTFSCPTQLECEPNHLSSLLPTIKMNGAIPTLPHISSWRNGNNSYLQLTLRRLMSYIYGAPILDVSRSHTTTQHSR